MSVQTIDLTNVTKIAEEHEFTYQHRLCLQASLKGHRWRQVSCAEYAGTSYLKDRFSAAKSPACYYLQTPPVLLKSCPGENEEALVRAKRRVLIGTQGEGGRRPPKVAKIWWSRCIRDSECNEEFSLYRPILMPRTCYMPGPFPKSTVYAERKLAKNYERPQCVPPIAVILQVAQWNFAC